MMCPNKFTTNHWATVGLQISNATSDRCVIFEPTTSSYTTTFLPFWNRPFNPIILNQRRHLSVVLSETN